MSTNYYGYPGHVHLCQAASGWEFLLQANPDRGITGIQAWLRQLDAFTAIRDEYGREITIDELLEVIEARIDNPSLKRRFSDPRWASAWVKAKEFRDGGAAFASYEFW